ncbi:site-2 protease family protein [Balneolaceae bacterium ANBcel3]|nr:site-2 protease family protein [Balneolaceae bacterium ANBcel3]
MVDVSGYPASVNLLYSMTGSNRFYSTSASPFGNPQKSERLQISVEPLLPIVMLVMAWILSTRYYPHLIYLPNDGTYWIMGVVSSLFLTFSIFFHEYGHALAARMFKLPLERIHLYLFGGMAELKCRPVRPVEELLIALAGPIASLFFALFAWSLASWVHESYREVFLVLTFIQYMNLLLCGFNLLPIFPLDGGRALRAVLWQINAYYYKASIHTYKLSIVFIGCIFLAAGIVFLIEGWEASSWIAILAVYLWYTAYNGRHELVYNPKFDDLVFRIHDNRSPSSIIRQINRIDSRYLTSAVIPVVEEDQIKAIVLGRDLERLPEEGEPLKELYKPLEKGYFVDIEDEATYKQHLSMKADLLPVLKNGAILGMSDANEIRFWLLQQKRATSGS